MTPEEIGLLRLQNQRITGEHHQSAVEITDWMGAMQAQDYYNALWALGLRTHQTEAEILQTLQDRTVIRTWPQRGTLHFVTAQNARWQVALSEERLLRGATTRQKNLGLSEKDFATCEQVVRDVLGKNTFLTRPRLLAEFEATGVSIANNRGYHILWYLAQTGVIYVGPMDAKQQTFGLLDELAPITSSLTREASIIALARRYFMSHAPATLQDFMWWAGLTTKDAQIGLTALQSELESVVVDTKIYWLPKNSATIATDSYQALLLPGFDEYLLGYKDRSAVLAAKHSNKVVPGSNGIFLPTIVLRGQIVGTWKRVVKKDHVQLNISTFEHLSSSDAAALQEPAAAYGRFLGLTPKITFV